jgi:3-phenylpropionate/cinnamic acid dioxygenase small subunit
MLSLQEISDRIEIEDLLVRYSHAVDTRDWDLFRSVFTEDAHIDYTEMGVTGGNLEETVAFLSSSMPTYRSTQHLVSNTVLAVEDGTAVARTMCFNPMVNDDNGSEHVFFCGAWYRDKLVRTPDGWRIRHRYVERSYVFNERTSDVREMHEEQS